MVTSYHCALSDNGEWVMDGEKIWVECWNCGGEGCIDGDCTCMDDTCCCMEPNPPVCDICKGAGGWNEDPTND